MTQEQKQLLLKDLCARLPYGVKVQYKGNRYDLTEMHKDGRTYLGSYNSIYGDWHCSLEFEDYPKPYLRPMSSMTDEEKMEFIDATDGELRYSEVFDTIKPMHESEDYCASFVFYLKGIVWLDKNMFDYRGLIPMGLAIEVTKENNPYKD